MSRANDLRDIAILQAMSGSEDLSNLGMQIEDNYFARELMENRREQGLRVPKKYLPETRSQNEIDLWKRENWLAELEQARTNKPVEDYAGKEEEMVTVKKDMGFADSRLFEKIFATNVNIKQVKSNSTGRWITIITLGKDQDKVFMVTARKDGNGTSLITDWPDYITKGPVVAKKQVLKV